jgi:hypothetical protein
VSDGKFKFFTSVAATIAWPLLICWYGEYLSEQVSATTVAFGDQFHREESTVES